MTLTKAKETAKKLNACELPIEHRNVWVFMADGNDVIITKDYASVKCSGVFLAHPEQETFVNAETFEQVSFEDVFGAPFYAGDSALLEDRISLGCEKIEDRIAILLKSISSLLEKTNTPRTAMFLVEDLIEEYDESAYRKLIVLNNYLKKHEGSIDMQEFAFMHHELFSMA